MGNMKGREGKKSMGVKEKNGTLKIRFAKEKDSHGGMGRVGWNGAFGNRTNKR